jgi:hypothetical protein
MVAERTTRFPIAPAQVPAAAPFPHSCGCPPRLPLSHLRCGKPTCHCADDRGHPVWSLTFMVRGGERVQHIPKEWVEEVRHRVKEGREFQDAVREVLAANAQLLVLERQHRKKHKKKKK